MAAQATLPGTCPATDVITVLRSRPASWGAVPVIEVLSAHGVRGARLANINDRAVYDGVNLALPLGRATAPLLRWVEIALSEPTRGDYPPAIRKSGWKAAHRLAGLVERHQHLISSTSAPKDAWGYADKQLWDALAQTRRDYPTLRQQGSAR